MSLFDDIKQRLDMKQVVEAYGFSVNRSGFCCCPFHAEKTASMKIYEKGYKCFGCGEGGDIIKFVQKYFDLSPIDACRKLNDDFSLGLETRSYRDPNKKAETVMLYQKRQELKEKENAFSRTISICNCKVSKNSTRVASFSRLNASGRRLLSPFSFICSKYLFWRWRLVFTAFIMTSYKAVFFVIVKFLTYFAHCFETLKIQGFFLFESPFLIRSHDTNDSHH